MRAILIAASAALSLIATGAFAQNAEKQNQTRTVRPVEVPRCTTINNPGAADPKQYAFVGVYQPTPQIASQSGSLRSIVLEVHIPTEAARVDDDNPANQPVVVGVQECIYKSGKKVVHMRTRVVHGVGKDGTKLMRTEIPLPLEMREVTIISCIGEPDNCYRGTWFGDRLKAVFLQPVKPPMLAPVRFRGEYDRPF